MVRILSKNLTVLTFLLCCMVTSESFANEDEDKKGRCSSLITIGNITYLFGKDGLEKVEPITYYENNLALYTRPLPGLPSPLVALQKTLSTGKQVLVKDYIQLTREIGEYQYRGRMFEALTQKNASSESPKDIMYVGIKLNKMELEDFLLKGSLDLKGGDHLKIITSNQVPMNVRNLLGDEEVMIALDPSVLIGMQYTYSDVETGSPIEHLEFTEHTLESIVANLMSPNYFTTDWTQFGWIVPVAPYRVPVWALKQILVKKYDSDFSNSVRAELLDPINNRMNSGHISLDTNVQYPHASSIKLNQVPLNVDLKLSIAQLVSLHQDYQPVPLSEEDFIKAVNSNTISGWLPLMGSKLKIQWANRSGSYSVTERLTNLSLKDQSFALPGSNETPQLALSFGSTYIERRFIKDVELIEYSPLEPSPIRIPVTIGALDNPEVRSYIDSDPKDLTQILTIMP